MHYSSIIATSTILQIWLSMTIFYYRNIKLQKKGFVYSYEWVSYDPHIKQNTENSTKRNTETKKSFIKKYLLKLFHPKAKVGFFREPIYYNRQTILLQLTFEKKLYVIYLYCFCWLLFSKIFLQDLYMNHQPFFFTSLIPSYNYFDIQKPTCFFFHHFDLILTFFFLNFNITTFSNFFNILSAIPSWKSTENNTKVNLFVIFINLFNKMFLNFPLLSNT